MENNNKDYLKNLSLEELEELFEKYDRIGKDVIRFDINKGLAMEDDAYFIRCEIEKRMKPTINSDNPKTKIKK